MLGALIGGAAALGGGLIGANTASKNRASQKEFAKNSVQWRAKDARKAGLHPLATMGYSGSSYTPVGEGGMGSAVSQAGQQIGDAITQAPKSTLSTQMAQSSMAVDAANVELLKAQKLQIMDNIRKTSVGLKGSTTALPNPKDSPVFDGNKIPYMPNTSSAKDFEDKHGEIGDLLAAIATLNAIDPSKPNPFFHVKRTRPFKKSTAKTHQSKRW